MEIFILEKKKLWNLKVFWFENKKIDFFLVYFVWGDFMIKKTEYLKKLKKVKDNFHKFIISMDEIDLSEDGIRHINILDFLQNTV